MRTIQINLARFQLTNNAARFHSVLVKLRTAMRQIRQLRPHFLNISKSSDTSVINSITVSII